MGSEISYWEIVLLINTKYLSLPYLMLFALNTYLFDINSTAFSFVFFFLFVSLKKINKYQRDYAIIKKKKTRKNNPSECFWLAVGKFNPFTFIVIYWCLVLFLLAYSCFLFTTSLLVVSYFIPLFNYSCWADRVFFVSFIFFSGLEVLRYTSIPWRLLFNLKDTH